MKVALDEDLGAALAYGGDSGARGRDLVGHVLDLNGGEVEAGFGREAGDDLRIAEKDGAGDVGVERGLRALDHHVAAGGGDGRGLHRKIAHSIEKPVEVANHARISPRLQRCRAV